MNAKKKLLIYYVSEFVLAVLLLIIFLIIIMKMSILNSNYFMKQLDKNDYYTQLSEAIYKEMTNYIPPSGLEESVLKDIYDESMLKREVKSAVDNFYSGVKISVKTDDIKSKLNDNIMTYIEDNDLIVDKQEDLDAFEAQIIKIYEDKIMLSSYLNKISPKLLKFNNMSTIILIAATCLFFILFALIKKVCHKLLLPAPCLTVAFLTFLGNFLLFSKISVDQIVFWNNYVSDMIKSMILGVSSLTKIGASMLIVIALVIIFIAKFLIKPKSKIKQ